MPRDRHAERFQRRTAKEQQDVSFGRPKRDTSGDDAGPNARGRGHLYFSQENVFGDMPSLEDLGVTIGDIFPHQLDAMRFLMGDFIGIGRIRTETRMTPEEYENMQRRADHRERLEEEGDMQESHQLPARERIERLVRARGIDAVFAVVLATMEDMLDIDSVTDVVAAQLDWREPQADPARYYRMDSPLRGNNPRTAIWDDFDPKKRRRLTDPD